MSRPPFRFLSARWENLILANFAAPAELLAPRLPPGVELDTFDGRHWCSLVAFQFRRTRVLGVPWPDFRDFPEWNLRFYVRRGAERGVVFVREFVPQRFVAWVARTLYNEPYVAATMEEQITAAADRVEAAYSLEWGGRKHTMRAVGTLPGATPGAGSLEAWFKEHVYGYGVTRRGRTLRYTVEHPAWATYPVAAFEHDVDWASLYGPEWAAMNGRSPESVVFAAGSAVAVYPFGTALGAGGVV